MCPLSFDTINNANLFYILEKDVGIGASTLRLIRSYFCERTQRVQIYVIISDFASLFCGVPQRLSSTTNEIVFESPSTCFDS